jgi:hypothetical protein
MRKTLLAVGLAAGGLLAVGAGQAPAPKPLMAVGTKYVVLVPSERKREVVPVEPVRADNFVKCKYKHMDGVERHMWLNLGQVVYLQPADE